MLAREGNQFVALAALGHLDAVRVTPFLDLGVGPRVEELVGEVLVCLLCLGRGVVKRGLELNGRKTRVAADGGDQLVTRARLRDVIAAFVEPGLEIRFGPGVIEPVARIVGMLVDLVGRGLVIGANGLEERVAFAWLGNGDAVLVSKSLQLGVGPAASLLAGLLYPRRAELTSQRSNPWCWRMHS